VVLRGVHGAAGIELDASAERPRFNVHPSNRIGIARTIGPMNKLLSQ
jgi:hypothetical protein